jgi:hypothetical protein
MKKVLLVLTLSLLTIFGFSQTAPTVTTAAINNIQELRAQGGGNVTSDGGSAVTKKGVVWSTSPNPKLSPIYKYYRYGYPSTGTGSFINVFIPTAPNYVNGTGIMPLLPGTTYYLRAFAINSVDTSYGNEVTFTTLPASVNKKYYFSTSGNDANNGLTPSTPKKTLIALQNMVTSPNVTFLPGDSILFKRGDMFANGYDGTSGFFDFVSFSYIDRPYDDYTAPSGTPDKPIVFSNYGDPSLPLPNFVFPTAEYPYKGGPRHWVLQFNGVSNIILDGLQFNDTRFPVKDKQNPAYSYGGLIMGEYINTKVNGTDTTWGTNRENGNRTGSVFNFTVQNCNFSNMSFGIGSVSAFNSKITKNTFTNFKSTVDTFGINDVLGGAIEALNGKNLEISYNYFKGAWAKSGRNSSTQGMGGICLDVFNLQKSKIVYNKIIDCSGFMEAGGLDLKDTTSGMYNDTIAYNLVINSRNFITLHLKCGDPFVALQYNIRMWNNIHIDNDQSRFSGNNFGSDIYGDGQDFRWWFWGADFLTTGYNSPTGTFTNGSNVITGLSTMGGIQVGTTVYGPERAVPSYFAGGAEDYATVVSVGVNSITLDKAPQRTGTTAFTVFPPLSTNGIRWSQPPNPSSNGYYGSFDNNSSNERVFAQFTGPACYGNENDTLFDMRNNIIWGTTGIQLIYPDSRSTNANGTRIKRSNNIYYVNGGFSHTFPPGQGTSFNNLSRLGDGASLTATERLYTGGQQIFRNITPTNPENWDYNLVAGSYGIGNGSAIQGITKDFVGVPIGNSTDIGLYKYSATPIGILVSSTNVTCKTATNGSFTVSANGGTAPYTYKVNNSAYTTTTTYSNLVPGTYMVTVKDAKGLLSTLNVTIKSSSVTCP